MILALTILIAFFTGLYLGRRGEQRRRKPVSDHSGWIRIIEGDELVNFRNAEGQL